MVCLLVGVKGCVLHAKMPVLYRCHTLPLVLGTRAELYGTALQCAGAFWAMQDPHAQQPGKGWMASECGDCWQ